ITILMMRTSNFFPLARRYSKQKARSRVQSTTNGGKALDRAFSFLLWAIKRKKGIKSDLW
ncbi:TPA: hypothetical protein ACXOJ0_003002, partial [Enterococcus faecium]